jgi:hypothetical protein
MKRCPENPHFDIRAKSVFLGQPFWLERLQKKKEYDMIYQKI